MIAASGSPAIGRHAPAWRRPLIVALYVAFFFGALPAVLWALGGAFDRLLALPSLGPASAASGAVLAVTGALWMLAAMASLSLQGRGLPISHLPPSRMVVRGPYGWMRHPIYAGYAAAFAGAGALTHSLGRSVGATALLLAGSLVYALGFEEPRLVRRHGHAHAAYAERVPALPVPRALAAAADRSWHFVRPGVERLANRVVLFRVGPVVCVSYGAFAGLGTALALALLHGLLAGALPPGAEAAYLLGLTATMLAGARLVALLYRPALLVRHPLEALRSVGFVSWGGYVGMFAFPVLFARIAGSDALWLLDRTCLAGLVCSSVGRVGCLAYGCCYGRPSESGVGWHCPEARVNRERGCDHGPLAPVRRVPTQLLSAACTAALVPVVWASLGRGAPGVTTLLAVVLYAFARFAVECLRDEPRFGAWGLTRGQMACLAAASAAIAGLLSFPALGHVPVAGPSHSAGGAGWTVVAIASLVVFVVCSFHWKRVGRW
jgi:phosphatidylglycerol:prolipoprotein diacylglycerol transferase